MSLRLRVHLLFSLCVVALVGGLLWLHLIDTRRAVDQEITASNRVATQLLQNVVAATRVGGDSDDLLNFLRTLGRVRATDIVLTSPDGGVLYASPASPYKAGRDAPAWYAALVSPEPMHERIRLPDSVLDISANASRAVLDGWDDAVRLVLIGSVALVLGSALMFWLLGRMTAPLREIVRGLERFECGDYAARLPAFATTEADVIARAFNRMGQSVQDALDARAQAAEANAQLQQSHELADIVQHRVEDERRQIARELHDETSQTLTAIRSMCAALVQRSGDGPQADGARLIAESASHLHATIHDLIPRLQTPDLDRLGLVDALDEQVARWRQQYPQTTFVFDSEHFSAGMRTDQEGGNAAPIGESYALAAYRIVQESTTNALRHAKARTIHIALRRRHDELEITVDDDGRGLPDDWRRPGHYGVRGMQERVRALDGRFDIATREQGGVRVRTTLPLVAPR